MGIREENKELKKKIRMYQQVVSSALTDYQNKQLLEERMRDSIAEIKKLESKTRSLAQQRRRHLEQKTKVEKKLIDRWKEMWDNGNI